LHDNKKTARATGTSIMKETSQKIHKRDDNYVQFGFTQDGNISVPDPQSALCYQTLGNSSMVAAKLQQHLHTKNADCKDRPITSFNCKCNEVQSSLLGYTAV
jgi:hypothetical protein